MHVDTVVAHIPGGDTVRGNIRGNNPKVDVNATVYKLGYAGEASRASGRDLLCIPMPPIRIIAEYRLGEPVSDAASRHALAVEGRIGHTREVQQGHSWIPPALKLHAVWNPALDPAPCRLISFSRPGLLRIDAFVKDFNEKPMIF